MKDLTPDEEFIEQEEHAQSVACAILNQIQNNITGLKHADQEILSSFGFDASKQATLIKWRKLSEKVKAGVITEKDRLREMGRYLWDEADRECNRTLIQKRNSAQKR